MERAPSSSEQVPNDRYMQLVPRITKLTEFLYNVEAEGLENIPEGPSVLVANHLKFADSVIIAELFANSTGRPLRLGAKAEYFEGKGIDNNGRFGKTMQRFVEDTKQIPVYRDGNGRGLVQLVNVVNSRLSEGESVLLHAEGTRSPDGRLNKFKDGAARFAIKNSVPLVPVSITYERRPFALHGNLNPRDMFRDAFTYAHVQFGEPLTKPLYGMESHHVKYVPDSLVEAVEPLLMKEKDRLHAVSDIAERIVASMTGQERSGMYINAQTKEYYLPATKAAK